MLVSSLSKIVPRSNWKISSTGVPWCSAKAAGFVPHENAKEQLWDGPQKSLFPRYWLEVTWGACECPFSPPSDTRGLCRSGSHEKQVTHSTPSSQIQCHQVRATFASGQRPTHCPEWLSGVWLLDLQASVGLGREEGSLSSNSQVLAQAEHSHRHDRCYFSQRWVLHVTIINRRSSITIVRMLFIQQKGTQFQREGMCVWERKAETETERRRRRRENKGC